MKLIATTLPSIRSSKSALADRHGRAGGCWGSSPGPRAWFQPRPGGLGRPVGHADHQQQHQVSTRETPKPAHGRAPVSANGERCGDALPKRRTHSHCRRRGRACADGGDRQPPACAGGGRCQRRKAQVQRAVGGRHGHPDAVAGGLGSGPDTSQVQRLLLRTCAVALVTCSSSAAASAVTATLTMAGVSDTAPSVSRAA